MDNAIVVGQRRDLGGHVLAWRRVVAERGATGTNDQIVSDPYSGLGATILAVAVDTQG